MRIVAGDLRGRVLRAPHGDATRPTSEKVREALFSILGPPAPGDLVLDLFAGAGGLGLEAISRGAAHATFVDLARPALDALRANIRALGVVDRTTVVAGDAARLAASLRPPPTTAGAPGETPPTPSSSHAAARWRWIFIDPPYASDLAVRAASAIPADVLGEDSAVVIEHDRRNAPPEQLGSLLRTDLRRYGDTFLSIYRPHLPHPDPAPEPP
jgi:16S rRNA (guanine966-N2)-methyltransferase